MSERSDIGASAKRNIKRFPPDFMFQLTEEEVEFMVSQNAIPSKQHLGGSLPFVFTEQGVATISSVLSSDRAIEVNIHILLIDNYVDESVLVLLSKRNPQVSAQILTASISKQLALDLKKHRQQYPAVDVQRFQLAHDRFLIIDNDIYHIGASLKDLGKSGLPFRRWRWMRLSYWRG